VREEEDDDGNGVGYTVTPYVFFYSTIENFWTIPAVHSEEGTAARI
jgi:hypothetical protein